jgi:DNA-binding MarR family transcriptional regulator
LASIDRLGGVTMGELASVERVQPPSMTRIVANLEEQGLIAREADALDRRISRLRVTPAGRRLLERSRTRKTAYLASRLRELTPEEIARLEGAVELLEKLSAP